MKSISKCLFHVMVFLLSTLAFCATAYSDDNLIRNGDFESPLTGTWCENHLGGEHRLKTDIDISEHKVGNASAKLAGTRSFLTQSSPENRKSGERGFLHLVGMLSAFPSAR